MLWKQPSRGNVVTQFLPNELKVNATPRQKKDDLSETPGFLSGRFNRYSLWSSEHAERFDYENVSLVPVNCIPKIIVQFSYLRLHLGIETLFFAVCRYKWQGWT